MAQEVLSHRKVIVEDPIEMTDLSGSHVGPARSLEATVKTCPQDVGEESKDTRTKKQKATERVQFAAVCWCLFLAGWNDWPIVTPDTGSVSCVFIRLSRYALFGTYFVSRSTLRLYL